MATLNNPAISTNNANGRVQTTDTRITTPTKAPAGPSLAQRFSDKIRLSSAARAVSQVETSSVGLMSRGYHGIKTMLEETWASFSLASLRESSNEEDKKRAQDDMVKASAKQDDRTNWFAQRARQDSSTRLQMVKA